jgi:hypothetical protein
VWLLLQALVALTFAAGPRAVGGPLHWHGAGMDHHAHASALPAADRHHHGAEVAAVMLDQGAPASEDLGSGGSANAAAAPWPARTGQEILRQSRGYRVPPPPAATWADADLSHPDHPPRG